MHGRFSKNGGKEMTNWATDCHLANGTDGVLKASEMLKENASAGDAVESLINVVEEYPYYKSVATAGCQTKKEWSKWTPPLWMATPSLRAR